MRISGRPTIAAIIAAGLMLGGCDEKPKPKRNPFVSYNDCVTTGGVPNVPPGVPGGTCQRPGGRY